MPSADVLYSRKNNDLSCDLTLYEFLRRYLKSKIYASKPNSSVELQY